MKRDTYRVACGGETWGAYLRRREREERSHDIPSAYALANLAFLRGDVLRMVRCERTRRQLARSARKRAPKPRGAPLHATRVQGDR